MIACTVCMCQFRSTSFSTRRHYVLRTHSGKLTHSYLSWRLFLAGIFGKKITFDLFCLAECLKGNKFKNVKNTERRSDTQFRSITHF